MPRVFLQSYPFMTPLIKRAPRTVDPYPRLGCLLGYEPDPRYLRGGSLTSFVVERFYGIMRIDSEQCT
jgi:hypothetical protein